MAAKKGDGLLMVYCEVPAKHEEEFNAWYNEEHIPMLLEVPGWRRIRRYRLVRGLGGPGPDFLSLHELAGPEVLEDPGYLAAVSTPWRDQVVASALRRERRVFGLRNAIGAGDARPEEIAAYEALVQHREQMMSGAVALYAPSRFAANARPKTA